MSPLSRDTSIESVVLFEIRALKCSFTEAIDLSCLGIDTSCIFMNPLWTQRRSLIERVYHMAFSFESLNNWFVHGSNTTDYPISLMRTLPSLSRVIVHSSHWSPSLTQSIRQTVPIACQPHLGSLWNDGRASPLLSLVPHSLSLLCPIWALFLCHSRKQLWSLRSDTLCNGSLNGGKRRPFGLPHCQWSRHVQSVQISEKDSVSQQKNVILMVDRKVFDEQ